MRQSGEQPLSDPPDDASRFPEVLAPIYAAAMSTLRCGFIVAAALFAVGIIWSAIAREELASEVMPVQDIPRSLAEGAPMAALDLAFLVLMLTPVATVLRVAVAFFRLEDRRFGMLSLVVLAILGASVTLALVR
jgi:uncharacterized membrane protein